LRDIPVTFAGLNFSEFRRITCKAFSNRPADIFYGVAT